MSKGATGGGAGPEFLPTGEGGRTAVFRAGGIAYVKSDRAIGSGDVAVLVDVRKIDAEWKKDGSYYIPKGGGSDRVKYDRARALVAGHKAGSAPIRMPQMTADKSGVSFTDGRHRFAALRDSGKRFVYVTVPRSQAKTTADKFGKK